MKEFIWINHNGHAVGSCKAQNPYDALMQGVRSLDLKYVGIDHVHEIGNTPVPCQHCENIRSERKRRSQH